MPPTINNIHETCLYSSDLAAMEDFYTRIMGLRKVSDFSERGFVLRINDSSVLLIFDPRQTTLPHQQVPQHGAIGPGHMAFACNATGFEEWKVHLRKKNIPIEREVTWSPQAKSIYFRDPAANSIEILTGELWRK